MYIGDFILWTVLSTYYTDVRKDIYIHFVMDNGLKKCELHKWSNIKFHQYYLLLIIIQLLVIIFTFTLFKCRFYRTIISFIVQSFQCKQYFMIFFPSRKNVLRLVIRLAIVYFTRIFWFWKQFFYYIIFLFIIFIHYFIYIYYIYHYDIEIHYFSY